jgi:hypothetical protein
VYVTDRCGAARKIQDGYGGTLGGRYRQWTGSAWIDRFEDFAVGHDSAWFGDGAWIWGESDVADVRFQACNRNETTGYVGTCGPSWHHFTPRGTGHGTRDKLNRAGVGVPAGLWWYTDLVAEDGRRLQSPSRSSARAQG